MEVSIDLINHIAWGFELTKKARKVRQMLLFLILATKAGSNNSVSSQEANLALSETRSV